MRNLTRDTHSLIKLPNSSSLDYKALFYQTHQMTTFHPISDTDVVYPKCLITLLLNDMQPSSETNLDNIHKWLRTVPQAALLQFFKSMPYGHSDILRERVFAAAMRAGDEKIVRSMLALGLDPGQAIDVWSHEDQGPKLPLCTALMKNQVPIARAILKQLCHGGTKQNLDHILDKVLICHSKHKNCRCHSHYQYSQPTSHSDWSDVVRSLLDAGAKPTINCFGFASNDPKLLGQVLEGCQENIMEYISADILRYCLDLASPWSHRKSCDPFLRSVLSYFLGKMIHKISKHDPAIIPAFWEALQSASRIPCSWAMDIILNAASLLGIKLGHADYDDATNTAIISACRESNWSLKHQLENEQSSRVATVPYSQPEIITTIEAALEAALEAAKRTQGGDGCLDRAESTPDSNHLIRLLRTTEGVSDFFYLDEKISQASSFGLDDIAVALSSHLDLTHFMHVGIVDMLERNKIAAISQVICQDQHWKAALLYARHQCNFEALDDLIHRTQTYQKAATPRWRGSLQSSLNRQMALRVLSYHAIHSGDVSLLKWLLQVGLCTSDLYGTFYDGEAMTSLYELSSYSSFTPSWMIINNDSIYKDEDESVFYLHSLLGVAASHNDALMVQFLLEEGVESGHSSALMLAVGAKANEALLQMLLAASDDLRIARKRGFGASALRAAIFRKNYDVLHLLLAARVDIDGIDILKIEDSQGSILNLDPLSPIGEAILRRDLKAAEILIYKGVNLNGLVTFDNYNETGLNNTMGSVLERASPLLAAIDTKNLPMVQLLVENGADVEHCPKKGLMRTPLQRAAEIGNFEIVQYLLAHGASVDSAPCNNGGTPLQLTALGGHNGIASLLLENGANLNHLPAKGNGRTALEAAAEWNRTTMMSLLVSWGVNFDLVVDDEGRTQYERATEFAEKRGRMASKRFLERLWAESGLDSFDMQLL
jgi:ankyrin repeat protein